MERADKQAIANWFSTWEKLIGRVDYALARDLFDSDVIGFGTHMDTVKGLDHLEQDQWRHVWPTIDGFRFDLDSTARAVQRSSSSGRLRTISGRGSTPIFH